MTELRNKPLPVFLSPKETDIDSLSIKGEDMTYYELLRLWEIRTDIICRVHNSIPVLEIDEGR